MSIIPRKPRVTVEDKFYMAYMNKKLGVSQCELAREFGKAQQTINETIRYFYNPKFHVERNKGKLVGADYLNQNPATKARNQHLQRIKVLGVRDDYIPSEERILSLYELAVRLTKATGIPYEVDHIRPTSKGGEHIYENLQVIPRSQNNDKTDNWETEQQLYYLNTIFND